VVFFFTSFLPYGFLKEPGGDSTPFTLLHGCRKAICVVVHCFTVNTTSHIADILLFSIVNEVLVKKINLTNCLFGLPLFELCKYSFVDHCPSPKS
jgi:hypothetical protein